MTNRLGNWRSERYRLLLIGVFTATAVVLSYDFVVSTGSAEAVFAIVGAGLLLALLVIVPVLFANRS